MKVAARRGGAKPREERAEFAARGEEPFEAEPAEAQEE